MHFSVITLFPEMLHALDCGITGRAQKAGIIQLDWYNPRDTAKGVHRSVDDKPYGGGPGMVMMAEPLIQAINNAKQAMPNNTRTVYLSPQGKRFDQHQAHAACTWDGLILVAGRYEGIDQRVIDTVVDEEWSLGDYVLSGGELAAMVMIDSITRLLPAALGDPASASSDSLSDGLLKYPQYTRPACIAGESVPKVLLSGDHGAIATWRREQSLARTWSRRPDLLAEQTLTPKEQIWLRTLDNTTTVNRGVEYEQTDYSGT
jgi:tRNA (guanine37-N1)-methyltransferase